MAQFDENALIELLTQYRKQLPEIRKKELYKWEATKHFQDNWDPNAVDIHKMLEDALSESSNLLTGAMYFPKGMLLVFAEMNPRKTLAALNNLFDESISLHQRLINFEENGKDLLNNFNEIRKNEDQNIAKSSYFEPRSASVYLAFMHPETNYMYKYSVYKAFSELLGVKCASDKFDKVDAYYDLCDSVLSYIKSSYPGLIKESDDLLPDDLANVDPNHHLLIQDIAYFAESLLKDKKASVLLNDYDPGISTETWIELLNDSEICSNNNLTALLKLKESGEATCKELSLSYGKTMNFYNSNISSFAEKVSKATNCPLDIRENGNPRYWSICCLGKDASKDQPGVFVWKLRSELDAALDEVNSLAIGAELSANTNASSYELVPNNYWWIVANPNYWSFDSIEVGETVKYTSYNEKGNKRRVFKYFQEAKPGDLVIGHHSTPAKQIVCLCEVVSELDDESEDVLDRGLIIRKIEDTPRGLSYAELKNDPIASGMEYFSKNPTGTLFKLSRTEYQHIVDLIKKPKLEPYTDDDFLSEVFIEPKDLQSLKSLLKRKKNLILQGAPGTGKTFAAKRLAYCLMGVKDPKRIELVQFHQSSTYDEFVIGYRPSDDGGFKVQEGIFTRFCNKAASDLENDYFFIIDEINRANISKVFGELLMLIESDHRDEVVSLSVGGTDFKVPSNLYIIGMMNTADRGLALIDYALRRRFAFYEMKPAFTNEHFNNEVAHSKRVARLVSAVEKLNKEIENDPALGRGFCIGHSYFCAEDISDDDADLILKYEIAPLIEEYWFDDQEKANMEIAKLKAAIQ